MKGAMRVVESTEEEREITGLKNANEKTLSQQIDQLGATILARQFALIDKLEKGQEVDPKEEVIIKSMMQHYDMIEKMYKRLKNVGRVTDGSVTEVDRQFQTRFEKIKSSMPKIVTDIPEGEKSDNKEG